MAESKEFFVYSPAVLTTLDEAISVPRLTSYLAAAKQDRVLAMKTYLWNARLAKAFLFPLQIAEVTTRNAMHGAFSAQFGGPGWVQNPPFALTAESAASHQRAVARLGAAPSDDTVVAALSFDFWSNLFRREYTYLWATAGLIQAAFPNMPAGEGRKEIQLRVARINHLRNRIAHHEPIHAINLSEYHSIILDMIGLRCRTTRDWTRRHSTAMAVVRAPPTTKSNLPGPQLSSVNLRRPHFIGADASIAAAMAALTAARPPVLIVGEPTAEAPFVALTAETLLEFLDKEGRKLDGMADFSAHSVADVVAATLPVVTATIWRSATTGDLADLFAAPGAIPAQRPKLAVVLDDDTNEAVGMILRSEVRY